MPDEPRTSDEALNNEAVADPTPVENTELSVQDRVYNLNKELKDMKEKKKDATKAFNDEIKRIQGEIDDLIEEEETQSAEEAAAIEEED